MRRAAAIDKNQPAIVEALRRCGAHVTITSQLKNAFDLIVVYSGTVYICEIKDGTLNPSARKLTKGELECKASIERAGGIYNVITSINDALTMIGELKPEFKLKDLQIANAKSLFLSSCRNEKCVYNVSRVCRCASIGNTCQGYIS